MACMGRVFVAMFAAWLLGIAPALAAPPGRSGVAAIRVDAFDVEQVAGLEPGTELRFSVFATSGAAATVLIDGVRRLVDLREVQPGVYEGSHLIAPGDRIRADSTAVATVWRDGAVARATLEEALVLDGAPPAPQVAPRAAPLEPEAPPRESIPPPAPFRDGTAVPPPVAAVPPPVLTRPAPSFTVPPAAVAVPDPRPPANVVACRDCAVVESIRAVEVPGGPAYLGAIAGGIAGAVFGDQIGKAHARHVTRLLGAVGGALAGHEIERSATSRTRYDASLRLPDGTLRVRRYDGPPPFRVGETIRLGAAGPAETARTF